MEAFAADYIQSSEPGSGDGKKRTNSLLTMLKTEKDNKFWLVTQPDHAQLAGALAANWGNDTFSPLGGYAPVPNPARLRAQAVFAITQHDNGWWEWDADPKLSPLDRLPSGLAEMVQDQQDGMNRWRIGLRRFPHASFANLLISFHPYWLYGIRALENPDRAFVHPLFWRERPEPLLPGSEEAAHAFLQELKSLQSSWIETLAADDETTAWIQPEILKPHARMLQLLDGLSLGLTSALIPARDGESRGLGRDTFELRDVPRRNWDDRVTIEVSPASAQRVVLNPYPFALNPLTVRVPARVFDHRNDGDNSFHTWWQSRSPEFLEFQLGSTPSVF